MQMDRLTEYWAVASRGETRAAGLFGGCRRGPPLGEDKARIYGEYPPSRGPLFRVAAACMNAGNASQAAET
ncbi:hypothetical protein Csa_011192 [Cucumis sativus]|uniref:Uncharacterized protein n=1 Tax=Cucumis sativus TaxID=3659 RepID=A0A0A0L2J7_CUCSA|nr:hypothetical protein Csa_011192 [Cucumis sativus]